MTGEYLKKNQDNLAEIKNQYTALETFPSAGFHHFGNECLLPYAQFHSFGETALNVGNVHVLKCF